MTYERTMGAMLLIVVVGFFAWYVAGPVAGLIGVVLAAAVLVVRETGRS